VTPFEPVQARVDPRQGPAMMSFFGRKGSGKSILAARWWATWPHDRLCIDVTRDALTGDDVERVESPLPMRWPTSMRDRTSLVFRPDPGSATYADDLDRAVGLALLRRGKKLLWLDEIGEHTSGAHTPPNMRRALHQGRHYDLSILMCGPRPIDVSPLVISQSDYVFCFAMPHPRDQERLAGAIGMAPRELAAAVNGLGQYEYLRYDAATRELVHFPPLPTSAPRVP